MTINKTGGNKHKKAKNKRPEEGTVNRKVLYAETGQVYAVVQKKLGGTHLQVLCSDGKIRQAIIPGKFRKRVWMNPNDVLLCTLDAVGKDDVCGIDHKYFPNDVATLRSQGLITFENDYKDDGDEISEFTFDDNGSASAKSRGATVKKPNMASTVAFNDMFVVANPNHQNRLHGPSSSSDDEDSAGSPTQKQDKQQGKQQEPAKNTTLTDHERKMQQLFSKKDDADTFSEESPINIDDL